MSSKAGLFKNTPISLKPMSLPSGNIFTMEYNLPAIIFKFGSDSAEIGMLQDRVRKISLYIHRKILEGLSDKACDDILRRLVRSHYDDYKEVFQVVVESNFLGEWYFAFYFKGENLFGELV